MLLITPFSKTVSSSVNGQSGADQYESDNTPDTATTIGFGVTQIHSIYPIYDVDYVRISINYALNLTISINTTQTIWMGGSNQGDLRGFYAQIPAPGASYSLYLVPGSKLFLGFSADQSIVDSYSISINGTTEPDLGNHDSNHTRDLNLEHPMNDILNYTGNGFEQDWYSFTIPQRMSIRAMITFHNVFESTEFYGIHAELYDVNGTLLAKNHYFYFEQYTPQSILATLDSGNYSLRLYYSNSGYIEKHQPYPYTLFLTSNITEYDQNWHYLTTDPVNGVAVYGQALYFLDGTLPANTTRQIVLPDWGVGAFHIEFESWGGNVNYSVLGTGIINSNTSALGYVTTSTLTIQVNTSNAASDYSLNLIQELGDDYEYRSSQENPFELHELNHGTTYTYRGANLNYPEDIDWFQFTTPRLGKLNITFDSTAELNITVYDETRKLISPQIDVNGNTTIFDFGETNSSFVFEISFLHSEDIFAQYNITVLYIESYVPINLTGTSNQGHSSNSSLPDYLLKIGVIFVVGILIMVVVQIKLKGRTKDILD